MSPAALARASAAGSSLTEAAYQRLREDVLACRLRPGERLNINNLCATLEVSLGAVREALARLTSEGLVIAEPQRGFQVAPISRQDLLDLTNARIEIESICLRRAIAAGDVDWESALVAAAHRLNRTEQYAAGDRNRLSGSWSEVHRAFHEALVSGCDNRTLLQVRRQLYAQSERYRQLSIPLAAADRDLPREHQEIMAAALARQTDRAVELMVEHLSQTTKIVLQGIEQPATRKLGNRRAARAGGAAPVSASAQRRSRQRTR